MSENNGDRELTFDDIEAFDDVVRAKVKAFGGTVELVSLGAEGMAEYLEVRAEPTSEGMRNTILLVYSMLKPADWELPKEARKELVYKRAKTLRKKNLNTLADLTKKALEINGLGEEQEAARKNDSGEVLSGASPTL